MRYSYEVKNNRVNDIRSEKEKMMFASEEYKAYIATKNKSCLESVAQYLTMRFLLFHHTDQLVKAGALGGGQLHSGLGSDFSSFPGGINLVPVGKGRVGEM